MVATTNLKFIIFMTVLAVQSEARVLLGLDSVRVNRVIILMPSRRKIFPSASRSAFPPCAQGMLECLYEGFIWLPENRRIYREVYLTRAALVSEQEYPVL